jgi:hypothetical protein
VIARWRRALLTGLAGLVLAPACARKEDVVVKTGADKGLTQADIDADPVRLLPAGAVGVVYVDARALFASRFGDKLYALAQKRAPLPAAAGFDAKRDLEKVWLGLYSMQGADAAGVVLGSFDRGKIEAAADGTATTPLGHKVTKTTYAKRSFYTAGSLGFSILTPKTALCGNDTGMRRALDRIEEGRARRQLPPNMAKLFLEPKTPIVAAADLTASPLPDAARRELAFLDGVKTLSLVGNFDEPGLNLAGTLTYADEAAAARGAQNVATLRATLERYATFMALLGIAQPIKKLEAQATGADVAFVVAVDGVAVAALLERFGAMLPGGG